MALFQGVMSFSIICVSNFVCKDRSILFSRHKRHGDNNVIWKTSCYIGISGENNKVASCGLGVSGLQYGCFVELLVIFWSVT